MTIKKMRTPYTGDVALILNGALGELEDDADFDRDLLVYLQSCYEEQTLGSEAALQKWLEALLEEVQA